MRTDNGITRIDISKSADHAGYLINVGDFMLVFSMVAGTTLLAAILYGTNEYRPHNAIEAGLQVVLTVALLGYVPLLAWRGYARRYWLAHAVLGMLLTLAVLAGIAAVLASGWSWTPLRTVAFAIFVAIWLFLAAIPLGFALTAVELLGTRFGPANTLLTEIVDGGAAQTLAPRPKVRSPRTLIGGLVVAVGMTGIAAIVATFALYGLTDKRDAALAGAVSHWLGAAFFVLPVCALCIGLGRRLKQGDAARLLEADERAPILLLRSFSDDAQQIAAKGLATRTLFLGLRGKRRLEAAIADEIARLGPFVAIGRPGEVLPPLGAARAYFGDDEWQRAVADWIARARLIVMIAGNTPWVRWELREIARAGQTGKLLLLLPPGDATDRNQRLDHVADALGDARVRLPDHDPARALMLRFHRGSPDGETRLPHITVIESAAATQVDYELGMRVANFAGVTPQSHDPAPAGA